MYKNMIKKLRDKAECHDYNGWVETAIELEEAADAIEELSRLYAEERNAAVELTGELASKPRWIPVMERLPDRFENVLVANKRGKHYDIDKGWWNGFFFDRCAKGAYHSVTHWMPLPEPPKEE